MRAALLLALLPALALAQPSPGGGGAGGGGASFKLGNVGSSPNAKAATLISGTLRLQPASATQPGVVTTGSQTFEGAKSFNALALFYGAGLEGSIASMQFFQNPVTTSGPILRNLAASGAAGAVLGTKSDTNVTYTTSGDNIHCFYNAGVLKACVNKDGTFVGNAVSLNSALSQGIFPSGTSTVVTGNIVYLNTNAGGNLARLQTTGIDTDSVNNPVPVVHAAQTTSPVAMEFGRSAASAGGALAVTFSTAFASAPSCVCTDENAVPVICGITTAPSVSAVTFSITVARADTLDWHCTGAK